MEPILKAVLGPTNTGKTHYAVERMLGRSSGVIGLPLRLLAREVYDRIVDRIGAAQVALITGEEKIQPKTARYFVCTVEAMPVGPGRGGRRFAFLAVDEVQLMSHHERGHIFTDRVLNARGYEETLFLGAETARDVLKTLVPKIVFERRERFSELSYAGAIKLNRLPKRSVIVAFSAKEVYSIAEAVRRFRGGAAVVMGGLSPRTRNAQAELFQSGDVDFLIATDAVGMGLNLDTHHVAFASLSKFDGRRRRYLTPMEAGQIAGRAGRFRTDGTFGTTAGAPEMEEELISRIVDHRFEPLDYAHWRNSDLDFASLTALTESLHAPRPTRRLRRIKGAVDEQSLERMIAIPEIANAIKIPAEVKQLWDVCQIPDFRGLTIDAHVRLLQDIYRMLRSHGGKLPDDYMAKQINRLDDTLGDVDTLSAKLARIRTWTYCAAKSSWMVDPDRWADEARAVEDRLSDALHDGLIKRFVDRRTSKLLKGIGSGAHMDASIKDDGQVFVDGHLIGQLDGLRFTRDPKATDLEAKALEAAAATAVAPEVDRRLTSLSSGQHSIFTLSDQGEILWGGMAVGRIAKSGSILNPDVEVIGAELGNPALRQLAEDRMREYLRAEVTTHLEPLRKLKEFQTKAEMLPGSKGFAFILEEHLGSIERRHHSKTIRELDQNERRDLRSVGVTFGQYNVYMPELTKPKPARLLSLLHAFGAGGDGKPFIPFAGVTSIPNDGPLKASKFNDRALALAGYKAVGPRIVRFDILNRLATQIRDAQGQFQAIAAERPRRPTFQIMQEMLALLGAGHEEVRGVLTALGFEPITAEAPLEKVADASPDAENAKPDEVKADDLVAAEAPAVETASAEQTVQDATSDSLPSSETTDVQASPEAPAEATSETTPAAPTEPEGPKLSKRQRGKVRAPLHVFAARETKEDGTTEDVPNLEYWVLPQRKRKGRGAGDGQGGGRSQARRAKFSGQKIPRGEGGSNRQSGRQRRSKRGKPGGQTGGYSTGKSSPPRQALKNSPFAALAALKAPETPKDASSPKPESKADKKPDTKPSDTPKDPAS